jgi:hypothetical protein
LFFQLPRRDTRRFGSGRADHQFSGRLRPEIAEVFALTGMDQKFDLYADRQQALASFTKARPWGGGTSHDTDL